MRALLPLLLAVPLVAGCGAGVRRVTAGADGFVAAPPTIAERGTETVAGTVDLKMGEDWFAPTVIRAPAGSTLTIRLANVGALVHAFDVAAPGQHVDVTLGPGRRTTVRVHVPAVGRLLFFCKFHWSRGMAGYVEPS